MEVFRCAAFGSLGRSLCVRWRAGERRRHRAGTVMAVGVVWIIRRSGWRSWLVVRGLGGGGGGRRVLLRVLGVRGGLGGRVRLGRVVWRRRGSIRGGRGVGVVLSRGLVVMSRGLRGVGQKGGRRCGGRGR